MARTPFKVEILTPEGEVFNDEVEMVSTKTSVGSIGLLANHQPLLAMLDPTELRLYKSESDVVRYAQGEGFLQIAGEHALVLVDEVFEVDELDRADLQDRLKRAEEECEKAEEGTEELRAAEREKRRYEAFLKIAGGAAETAWHARLGDGRARAHRAPDHVRHVQRGRAARRGGLHQGLARGARDRRRRPQVRRPARAQRGRRPARGRRARDARLPRPLRRRARAARSSSSRASRATGCSAAAPTT